MKNHTIKTPTAELLIVELPNSWGLTIGEEALLIYDHTKKTFGKTHTFNGHYTLLGKPDEIKEEDARELVESDEISDVEDYRYQITFIDYKDEENSFPTAKESLLSLIESEIYWDVNPLSNEIHAPDIEEWHEAQEKTFDKNRSLIFVKKQC